MRKILLKSSKLIPILLLVAIFLAACRVIIPPTPVMPTPRATQEVLNSPTSTLSAAPPTSPASSPAAQPTVEQLSSPGELAPLAEMTSGNFSTSTAIEWDTSAATAEIIPLPVDLNQVSNPQVVAGLTSAQRSFLSENGFVILRSADPQFIDIREGVSARHGQPYFLATDAAYHAFHLAYAELLPQLEREELYPRMLAVTRAIYEEIISYFPLVEGTQLEDDTRLAAAYMAVGLKLLDPDAEIDPSLESLVMLQVEQILAAEGTASSALFPELRDDYSAYIPSGHYAGDRQLEYYYRGMTWFESINFQITGRDSDFVPSRVPLIVTLALRHAGINGISAALEWAKIHETITFLAGPGDDPGPVEYSIMMDQAYSQWATIISLLDDDLWRGFLTISQSLPPPRINSTLSSSLGELGVELVWRFMGPRFKLDEYIMDNLIYESVGTPAYRRVLPSGLDVMAALDSTAAQAASEGSGATSFENYPEQFETLKSSLAGLSESDWLSTAGSTWLFANKAQLAQKDEIYPGFMRTPAWEYKDLNSALGSWVELKHDTVLSSTAPETAAASGLPVSGPAPAYAEPNPEVFYRLANLAHAISEGLKERGLRGSDSSGEGLGLDELLDEMSQLGDRLVEIGDIASRELQGDRLNQDDYRILQSPLGGYEERVASSRESNPNNPENQLKMPPVPVISAPAAGGESILQAGTGDLNRIYVIVPVDDEYQISQGGVYSYYEFPQSRQDRLTDRTWRLLLSSDPPDQPAWTENLILPNGHPVDSLVFRVGDTYILMGAAENLNLRESPSRDATVIRKLAKGEYMLILDGPVQADGFTWWKFRTDLNSEQQEQGWAVEDPEWYQRAWGR